MLCCQDDRKFSEGREDEGMGTADIKYGDTLVYVQHIATGFWLSYKTFETKKRGVGRVEEKKVGHGGSSVLLKLTPRIDWCTAGLNLCVYFDL